VKKKQPTTSAAAALLHGKRWSVAQLSIVSLAGGLTEALFLVVITRAAFAVTNGDTRLDAVAGRSVTINQAVLIALVLVVARVAFALLGNTQAARLSARVTREIRTRLAGGFLNASWPTQQADRAGRLQELLTTFAAAGSVLISGLTSAIVSGFNLLALLGLAIAVNPGGSVVTIVAVAVLGSVLRPVRRKVKRQSERTARASMGFATSLNEISQLGMELHIFNVQDEAKARVDALILENERTNERLNNLRGLVPILYSGLAFLAIVGAIGIISLSNSNNLTSVGAVMLVMLRSLSYGQGLQSAYTSISATVPFVDALDAQMQTYQDGTVSDEGLHVESIGTMELADVSFHYAEGRPVLQGITAELLPHEVIGIVGPSGSGKSTLVQLMLGLREPTAGQILANGRAIGGYSRAEWARKVTFVPQAAHLIAGSVAENIRFLRDGVSDDDVERAARLAYLHDDIVASPEGYSREVGEGGSHLSGGQQQRLCIARALVESPELMILDEPTSALDVRSESLIRQTLADLRERMTVVVIAHRMSTLEICDRIMVIQDGQLRAFDRPDVLETTSDFYREALELSGMR